jgi:isochorismate synthase
MEGIVAKAKNQLEQRLPFVLYCKPNSEMVVGLFQQNDELYEVEDFTEKGFVFASFDGSRTYLIPENKSERISVIRNEYKGAILEREFKEPNAATKNDYERLVAKGIRAVENDELKKVVLSRKEIVAFDAFDLVSVFEQLVQLYPATFVYCFFHPKVGIWLGATPEQLLKANGNVFETMALAGTQKDSGSKEIVWDKKEKDEQQYVTDYIVSVLQEVALEVSVTQPYSVKAGSIWHIKTDICGMLNSNSSLQHVINLLHPTPAVCGLPKEQSKAFILENENYDRSFYTGFLGELNSSFAAAATSSDLFVNLRCMQIIGNQAALYMGCGITKESRPEKEWAESVNKSMTMKKVL